MKAIRLLALATSSLLALGNRCQQADEAPCPDQEIIGTVPILFPCRPDPTEKGAKVFVINSVQEYGNTFGCSSTLPSRVDFTQNTLLVGWKNYCCCGHVKRQSLRYACAANTYTYRVEIEAGVCQAVLPVASVLLVPKLPAGAKVLIEME
ncbi:MAG: hypothetical protein ACRYFK_06390 [Janthinobacterium lividum]